MTSRSPVLSCLSRSFTPTCTGLIVLYLFSSLAFEVRTFLSHCNLLRMCFVLRIEFPDYPSCERLRNVSRDELMSAFSERLSAWGEHLFTPCRPFAKILDS